MPKTATAANTTTVLLVIRLGQTTADALHRHGSRSRQSATHAHPINCRRSSSACGVTAWHQDLAVSHTVAHIVHVVHGDEVTRVWGGVVQPLRFPSQGF